MISLKFGAIIIGAFAAGAFVMSPVPQAIAAIIATDVQCTGCVGTADVAGNAITAAKIKDGEVKAPEIATDAVGAAELQGVTKLLFGQCVPTDTQKTMSIAPSSGPTITCNIPGVDADDSASATLNGGTNCFEVARVLPSNGGVTVYVRNDCSSNATLGFGITIAVIVYDK